MSETDAALVDPDRHLLSSVFADGAIDATLVLMIGVLLNDKLTLAE